MLLFTKPVIRAFAGAGFLLLLCLSAGAQLSAKERDSLRVNIARVASSVNARVGVSVSLIESPDTVTYRGEERFPMLSVYKFPIAIAVMKEMDRGNLWMERSVRINKDSIYVGEEEKYADNNFPGGEITVGQLVTLMLVQGSNTASGKLLEVIKGPANLQAYLDDLDMHDMAIGNTGREVDADSLKKDNNWTTPVEMNRLLSVAYSGDYLSVKNHDFLWDKMTETVTAPARLKGLLPRGTKVAHSSGTGYGSYNDVGIIFLPKGKHLAVSVFIADAQDTPERCDAAIAKIAKLAWDYYSRH